MAQPNSVDVLPATGTRAVRQTRRARIQRPGEGVAQCAQRGAHSVLRRQFFQYRRGGFIQPGRLAGDRQGSTR